LADFFKVPIVTKMMATKVRMPSITERSSSRTGSNGFPTTR
jgi:hypothetical protein